MKKLKIAIISPYFYPLRGGVENNALNMALQLVKAGHDVTVFTSHKRGNKVFARRDEVYQSITIRRLYRAFFPQYYLTFLPSLLWFLLRERYDVVHTHIPGVFWHDLCVGLAKLFRRVKIAINTPHDPFMSRDNYRSSTNVLKRIYEAFLRLYYARIYNFAIAVNPNQYDWINAYGIHKNKIIYVPNGINPDLLKEIEVGPQDTGQFGLTNQIVITTVARYHEYKGYQYVLEALHKLKHERKLDIKYFGIGEDTGMLARLENYVRDNDLTDWVTLLESPSDTVRDQLLQISEIFILPSRVEAFGIAILEAMAKGNAIITTNTEGGKFLVGKDNGYLFDFGDSDRLAEIILELAANNELRHQLAVNNYLKAKSMTWENNTKEFIHLLTNLA